MADRSAIRLRNLPTEIRCLLTLFALLLSAGYAVALLNIYTTYEMADGNPGLSAEDLRRSFYGRRHQTRLAAKIDGGSMEQFLPNPLDKAKILNWIQDGTPRAEFDQVVQPIFMENCWRCHNPQGFMYMRPLQTYEQVQKVTFIDRGEPLPVWTRVAHTHLQSLALIFLALGLIFSLSDLPSKLKTLIVSAPFVAVLADFGARFLARYHPGFVYVVMAAGALAAAAFAVMVVVPLYQMWLGKKS